MGQRLFEPPSVEGWKGHRAWLNSATMLVRLNTASAAVAAERFNPDALLAEHEIDAPDVAAFLVDLLLDGTLPDAVRGHLVAAGDARAQVRVLLSLPEYQLA